METFEPWLPVSVVVPYYEAPEKLALALAGLEGQTYPRHLFEVVIVDDGSRPPLEQPSSLLDVTVLHQEDRGFGLARARNNGARASKYDILVFLDCDMIPEADLLAAHARWHHVVADAVTQGTYVRVSAEGVEPAVVRNRPDSVERLFAERDFDPPWIERHMARTANFTSKHDDIFRAASGGNLGVRKDFYATVGGYDESFTRYGLEDTEFMYRAHIQGGLLVPAKEALAWHQDRWDEDGSDRDRKQDEHTVQLRKVSNLIAHPGFRKQSRGRIFDVPQYVVTVRVDREPNDIVLSTVDGILADPESDLVVRVEFESADRDNDAVTLRGQLGADPRVRIAPNLPPLEGFPASPFHVTLQPTTIPKDGIVRPLRARLGIGVLANCTMPVGMCVSIARAWALHRATRAGKDAADFGLVVTAELYPWHARLRGVLRRFTGGGHSPRPTLRGLNRVWTEVGHVRGPRTGLLFLHWLLVGAKQSWGRRSRPHSVPSSLIDNDTHHALGVEIVTIGERARAVFAAAPNLQHGFFGQHVDVVFADSPTQAGAGVAAECTPFVVLSDNDPLSVPALDLRSSNPVGWVRVVENRVAVLGAPHHLPRHIRKWRTVVTRPEERSALRHCHHLVDVAAFHANVSERAGVLVRIAATGLPVRVADHSDALKELLGPELYEMMTTPMRTGGPDDRESRSIQMRRLALRDHSLRARARQVAGAKLHDPPNLPCVSIVLATNRPAFLANALDNVARQDYPRLELVLALHGDGFDQAAVEHHLSEVRVDATSITMDARTSFGSVLRGASEVANGTLLTKMDDDDVYDSHHVWDLVLAHEYSGAQLVGKGCEFVYLKQHSETIERDRSQAETFTRNIAGGSMLISREDLMRCGGWKRVHRFEDEALIDDVLRYGGAVYRTHGMGYILIRHGQGHTWRVSDNYFRDQAVATHRGWCPSVAGVLDPSLANRY